MPKTRGPEDVSPSDMLKELTKRISGGQANVEEFIGVLQSLPPTMRIESFWCGSSGFSQYSAKLTFSLEKGTLRVISCP